MKRSELIWRMNFHDFMGQIDFINKSELDILIQNCGSEMATVNSRKTFTERAHFSNVKFEEPETVKKANQFQWKWFTSVDEETLDANCASICHFYFLAPIKITPNRFARELRSSRPPCYFVQLSADSVSGRRAMFSFLFRRVSPSLRKMKGRKRIVGGYPKTVKLFSESHKQKKKIIFLKSRNKKKLTPAGKKTN